MTDAAWVQLAAGVALLALMAYAVLGGADFGGGVWDLFAGGERKRGQREAIARAMGPVWEANHVWLIFLLVILFTCFPKGYAALVTALFLPFHLALAGIMLRGAAFVFRGFTWGATPQGAAPQEPPATATERGTAERGSWPQMWGPQLWGSIFGIASVATPFLLGTVFGVLTAGRVLDGDGSARWLSPYPLGCGLLALSTCAYLAAVYLMAETEGALREDFRRRAIFAGTATALLAGIVLVLAWREAEWFFRQLLRPRALPVIGLGLFLFAASAWAVFTRHFYLSRVFAAGEVVVLLLGWGLAHREYLIYPQFTLLESAAPVATIRFLMLSLPVGAILVGPSLWLLLKMFSRAQRP